MIVLMFRDTTMLFRVDLGGRGNEYFVTLIVAGLCSNLVKGMAKFVDIFIVRCYLSYKDRENEYLKDLISFEICDIGNIIKF